MNPSVCKSREKSIRLVTDQHVCLMRKLLHRRPCKRREKIELLDFMWVRPEVLLDRMKAVDSP